MCGVAGWIGGGAHGPEVAEALIRALRHRGPDARDHRSWPEAMLVHTRLSILDLSPTGAQPMSNEDGSIWTVFNGEIYNHAELRRELEAKGHRFRGRSDTEVLPHLYEEHGPEFVARLRGMFAFALYDAGAKRLLLARDRFGIKPLFYAPTPDRLAFASELNAVRLIPGIDLTPDRQALSDLAALFYIPAPATFFTGVRALEPGQVLEASYAYGRVRWTVRGYHQWTLAPDPALTFVQAVERADDLIQTAVRRQMQSDVPLGSMLSGGIDSSLVSAAAQMMSEGALRTFNVRFPDAHYDETWAAHAVASRIQSRHETLDIQGGGGTWDSITALLEHAGQPFADTSLFAVNAVCQQMRRHVTVAFSGDGGDEAFGGYDTYWQAAWIARWQILPPALRKAVVAVARRAAVAGVVAPRRRQRFEELSGADDPTILERLSCYMGEEEHRRFCPQEGLLPVRRHFERQWDHALPRNARRTERLSALATEVGIRLTLPNDFLFKVDTASMKESMEVRVPMLDEDLVDFGLTIPHSLKVHGRTAKRVLRGVAALRLPANVASKKKRGFRIPVDRWVDNAFRTSLRTTLLEDSSPLPDFFDPGVYVPWIEAFSSGQGHPEVSRAGLYGRAILLLGVHQALTRKD